tara:strand:+ start:270 stop:857 length:588 start_codon:yes stop_codon:yes gene_type:complete
MKPLGLRLNARPAQELRCGYCTDQVPEEASRTCPGCGLKVHPDCLLELGPICPTVGCGGTTPDYRGPRSVLPQVSSGADSDVDDGWKILGVIAGIGAISGAILSPLVGSGAPGVYTLARLLKIAALGALAALGGVVGIGALFLLRHLARQRPWIAGPLILLAALGLAVSTQDVWNGVLPGGFAWILLMAGGEDQS